MRAWAALLLLLDPAVASSHADGSPLEVTARVANVRAEPSLQARVVHKLAAGDRVEGLEQQGEWWRVRIPAGDEGFLHRSVVEAVARPAEPAPPPPPATEPPAPVSGGLSVSHESIDCIVAGEYSRVEARLAPADRVARARAYFRAAGTPVWYYVEMRADPEAFVGVLPQAKRETERVEYYVQALDASFGEARTPEHTARVVGGRSECSERVAAAVLPAAKVLVGAPAGAPLVPAGFSPAGIAGATGGAGGGGAGASGAGSGGGPSGKALALIGGGAAAVGVVALAAGGGGDSSGPAAQQRPAFFNARFNPSSVTCSSTTARNGFFVANLLVDASNPTTAPVTVTSASDVLTFVAVSPGSGNAVGQSIAQSGLRFSPDSVSAGAGATIQFQLPLAFQDASRCRSVPAGTSQLGAELSIVTSAGSFSVRSEAPLNLVYP